MDDIELNKQDEQLSIINARSEKSIQQIKVLKEYFSDIGSQVQNLAKTLTMITKQLLPNDPNAIQYPGYISPQETIFSSAWHKLMENELNPANIMQSASKDFGKAICDSLNTLEQSYTERYKQILQSLKAARQKLEKANSVREEAMRAYAKAAANLKEGSITKDAFLQAQRDAVQKHNEYNDTRFEASTEMDCFLSEFELLENSRYLCLESLFNGYANIIQSLSEGVLSKEPIEDLPITDDQEKITSSVVYCQADDRFQIIPVLNSATEFLNMEQVFQAEIKAGGFLLRVTQDQPCRYDQIAAKQNEIVVGMKYEGDRVLCKNINESIGYLPRSSVQRL